MNDDDVLKELGRVARERDVASDPRWAALAENRLAPADVAALEALAERSPDHAAALAAFRPLDEAACDRLASVARAALERDGVRFSKANDANAAKEAREKAAETASEAAVRAEPREGASPGTGARVVPIRSRFGRAFALAGSLAAAAAVVLALRSWGDRLASAPSPIAEMPAYVLDVMGGDRLERGAPEATAEDAVRLAPGSRLSIVLRPATAITDPIAARGFFVRDGRAEAWSPSFEFASGGAVRIAGTREALFGGAPDGDYEIVLVVGRPADLPATIDAAEASARDGSRSVQVLRRRIRLASGPTAP